MPIQSVYTCVLSCKSHIKLYYDSHHMGHGAKKTAFDTPRRLTFAFVVRHLESKIIQNSNILAEQAGGLSLSLFEILKLVSKSNCIGVF